MWDGVSDSSFFHDQILNAILVIFTMAMHGGFELALCK